MPTISYDDAFTPTPPNLTTIIFSKELGEQEDMETQYNANGWFHNGRDVHEQFSHSVMPNCNGTGIPDMYVHMIGYH